MKYSNPDMQIRNNRGARVGTTSIMSTFCGPKGLVTCGSLQWGWGLTLVN